MVPSRRDLSGFATAIATGRPVFDCVKRIERHTFVCYFKQRGELLVAPDAIRSVPRMQTSAALAGISFNATAVRYVFIDKIAVAGEVGIV